MKPARFLLSLLVLLAIAHLSTAWIDGLEQMGVQAMIAAMPGLSQPWGEFFWNPHHPEHACNWEGINCATLDPFNPDLQSIISIDLESKTGGFLPEEIGYFPNLTKLTLFETGIEGTLPASLGTLENLESLVIAGSTVSGSLPDLRNMKKLKTLTLKRTSISDKLPDYLASLPSLEEVVMTNNQLLGTIPASWSNWNSIKTLDLGFNKLTGSIPGFTGDWNLRHLRLPGNLFTGSLPIYIPPSLIEIDLSRNQLSGSIPSWKLHLSPPDPSVLFTLDLQFNFLSGNIPDMFGSTPSWDTIDLSHNNLTGSMPESLTSSNLFIWTGIFLNHNNLNLCPGPSSFKVRWGPTKRPFFAPDLCFLDHQLVKPQCSCLQVYKNTPCETNDCA
jgi:Leucine-rich repeat (LRR) protein